ncbi:putative lactoylglutathione lyase [Sphingobium sp. B2D3A]|uniref:VOC family protein n=1 Tax=unclassified Sphingobium TaxID=2611147 RepID=UPI0022243A49|nr:MULTISPECIES: VOC family protein [unclassified Sphingobium]MCW2336296.1 putative lactoylglutathione lyase [Sphingobium sp. B2D3A]MCW2348735.1 putative lactoylglutathione lyase [Sphingobium sp. B12D2B]MCW2367862.1 putative lactoylglutathione lyase [Sphingobium sp. B11D3D]MCW2386051.1 putative lactoylglutathione lyase [Sphingobium sp. B2D3D]
MERMIFVNLPVTDLSRSMHFYEAIGAVNVPEFTDDSAAMMRFSDAICVMLLTRPRFSSYTDREIIDAHRSAQAAFALSEQSREAVDDMVQRGAGSGGLADPNPMQDHGFMYARSIADPDGHIWEPVWMDMSAMPEPA